MVQDRAHLPQSPPIVGTAIAAGPPGTRPLSPAAVTLDAAVDLAELARRHELCGGAIMNVVRHACLAAADDGSHRITLAALQRGIRRELAKEGRIG